MCAYSLLLYFTILRLFLKKPTKTAKLRCAVISMMLCYLITANIMTILTDYSRDVTQQLTSFFIILFYVRNMRESWKQIIMVVYNSMAILFIIVSYLTFFALLGYTIFSSVNYDDDDFFPNVPKSLYNQYVLFTTSNFPDIMFPFWKVHNWTSLVFIFFLLFGLYMLLNLMLAVFYNSYKHQIEKKISKYDTMREEFLK